VAFRAIEDRVARDDDYPLPFGHLGGGIRLLEEKGNGKL
jgi:hypothetical protein